MNTEQNRLRAKPATPERYLWEKPASRHLWFRYSVPARFRSVEAKKIIQRSTGTRNRLDASIIAARWRTELHDQWEALLGPDAARKGDADLPLTEPSIFDLQVAATAAAYTEVQTKLDVQRRARALASNEAFSKYTGALSRGLLRLVRTRDTEARLLWERVANRLIEQHNWLLPRTTPRYTELIEMIAEAGLEALRVDIERNSGNIGAQPTSKVVSAGLAGVERTAAGGESILELFDRYASQRSAEKRKRADTLKQDRKVLELFAEFVGPRRSLRSITRYEIRDWRDTIALLPGTFRKHKVFKDLSVREAATKAKSLEIPALQPVTVNKYLSTLSPLFDWACRNGYVDSNPCQKLYFDIPKNLNPRPPFDAGQLNTLLSSPLFTGFLRHGKEFRPGDFQADDWRKWIPLACLFTGARIGEVAQLQVDDVKQEGDISYLLIRNDEKRGQRTKSGTSRPAVPHAMLLEAGFLDFVARQQKRAELDGNRSLFPDLKPNDRGEMGSAPSRWFRTYLQRIGLKQGRDGFGAHSFRHLMADELRKAGYLDDEIEVALGHNQRTVTGGYGRIRQGTVNRLHEMMQSVQFSGVTFDHLKLEAA